MNEKQTTAEYNIIQSKNHTITTHHMQKSALSCYDDKRFLFAHTSDTLAYGHYEIRLRELLAARRLSGQAS